MMIVHMAAKRKRDSQRPVKGVGAPRTATGAPPSFPPFRDRGPKTGRHPSQVPEIFGNFSSNPYQVSEDPGINDVEERLECPDFGSTEEERRLQGILLDLMLRHRYVIRTAEGRYRFVCEYWHDFPEGLHECPNNDRGICRLEHEEVPWFFVHKFNGRKMFKCPCG